MAAAATGAADRSSGSATRTTSSSGTGCPTASSGCSGRRSQQVLVVHPTPWRHSPQPVVDAAARRRSRRARGGGPRRGGGQDRRGRGRAVGALGQAGVHPHRRRRRASAVAPSPTSPASSRPPGCAGWPWCTCRRRCSRWSTRRSGARPASTPPRARTWSARSTSRPGVLCDLDALATLPAARLRRRAGRGRQGGLHRRPGDPRPRRGRPGGGRRRWDGPHLRELVERAIAGQGRRRGRRTSRESWLREILNYGHTFGHAVEQVEGYRLAARRGGQHRHDVRRRARPAARVTSARTSWRPAPVGAVLGGAAHDLPGGSFDAAAGRDAPRQEVARRRCCASSCSRASAARCGSRGPTRPAARRLHRHLHLTASQAAHRSRTGSAQAVGAAPQHGVDRMLDR